MVTVLVVWLCLSIPVSLLAGKFIAYGNTKPVQVVKIANTQEIVCG